jgi:hypothetical protein
MIVLAEGSVVSRHDAQSVPRLESSEDTALRVVAADVESAVGAKGDWRRDHDVSVQTMLLSCDAEQRARSSRGCRGGRESDEIRAETRARSEARAGSDGRRREIEQRERRRRDQRDHQDLVELDRLVRDQRGGKADDGALDQVFHDTHERLGEIKDRLLGMRHRVGVPPQSDDFALTRERICVRSCVRSCVRIGLRTMATRIQ